MSPAQPDGQRTGLLRTGLASTAFALLGWAGASWLTEGFQVWTAEGARRHAVLQAPVPAQPAALRGDGVTGLNLHSLLARPGQATIVSFIYTRCPSVCQALGSSFQQLQAAVSTPGLHGGEGAIRLLSISFDPAYDDATQLQGYASLWQADARYWLMAAVPDPGQLQRLLKAWQVVVIADGRGGFEHNAALLVIDERGRLVRIFDDNEGPAALAYARALLRPGRAGTLTGMPSALRASG